MYPSLQNELHRTKIGEMDAEQWPDLDSDVGSPQHVKKDLDDIFEGGGGANDDQLNDTSGWSDLDIDEGEDEPSENSTYL